MLTAAENSRRIVLLLGCVLSVAGCETARYVSKDAHEGIIAMPADTEKNRKKAERLMAAHFPDGYEIVHEYEETVGSTTTENFRSNTGPGAYLAGYADASRNRDLDHKQGNSAQPWYGPAMLNRSRRSTLQSTTLDKTEWRIRYRRKQTGMKPKSTETSIAEMPST